MFMYREFVVNVIKKGYSTNIFSFKLNSYNIEMYRFIILIYIDWQSTVFIKFQ